MQVLLMIKVSEEQFAYSIFNFLFFLFICILHLGDSDYKPADEEARSRLASSHSTPPPSCSSSSSSTSRKRPRRAVGPPRKFLPDSGQC